MSLQGGSLFGGQQSGGSLFGSQQTSGPLFGTQNVSSPFTGQPSGPLFGNQQANSSSFGNQQSGGSLFGTQQSNVSAFGAQQLGGPLFGNQKVSSPFTGQPSGPLFGNHQTNNSSFPAQQSGGSLFGNQQPNNSSFLSQQSGGSLFGNQQPNSSPFLSQLSGGSLFGNQQPNISLFPVQLSGGSLFGTQQSGGSLFGNQASNGSQQSNIFPSSFTGPLANTNVNGVNNMNKINNSNSGLNNGTFLSSKEKGKNQEGFSCTGGDLTKQTIQSPFDLFRNSANNLINTFASFTNQMRADSVNNGQKSVSSLFYSKNKEKSGPVKDTGPGLFTMNSNISLGPSSSGIQFSSGNINFTQPEGSSNLPRPENPQSTSSSIFIQSNNVNSNSLFDGNASSAPQNVGPLSGGQMNSEPSMNNERGEPPAPNNSVFQNNGSLAAPNNNPVQRSEISNTSASSRLFSSNVIGEELNKSQAPSAKEQFEDEVNSKYGLVSILDYDR